MTLYTSLAARRLTSAIAAAALALAVISTAVTPARAGQNDDLAKAIAAFAAIAIIGNAIQNNDRPARRITPEVVHSPRWDHDRHGRSYRHDRRAQVLPVQCAVEVRGHRGSSVLYVERCLRRNGVETRLPRYCATDVIVRGRTVTAFPARCLQEAGYRINRRD